MDVVDARRFDKPPVGAASIVGRGGRAITLRPAARR
jgi:hypothetical protein